jgi:hypothetical protein
VADERSPRGRLRSEQALTYWRERLAELPPVTVEKDPPRADPPWQRWALWSPDVAVHAAELAVRTGTSTSAVMLTLAAIATAALQGREPVGLLLISGNRFTPRERLIAGPTLQDALIVHHGDPGRSLTDLIKATYRNATEAYFNSRCDPVALAALRDEAAATGRPDLSWYFNDARLGREWEPGPTSEPAGEPFLVRGQAYSDMTFCLGLAQRGPNCEAFLLADTGVLPVERIQHFLRQLAPLLSRALREEVDAAGVAEALLGAVPGGSR